MAKKPAKTVKKQSAPRGPQRVPVKTSRVATTGLLDDPDEFEDDVDPDSPPDEGDGDDDSDDGDGDGDEDDTDDDRSGSYSGESPPLQVDSQTPPPANPVGNSPVEESTPAGFGSAPPVAGRVGTTPTTKPTTVTAPTKPKPVKSSAAQDYSPVKLPDPLPTIPRYSVKFPVMESYYNKLTQSQREGVVIYFYRDWVVELPVFNKTGGTVERKTNCLKWQAEDGDLSLQALKLRLGSGVYHALFNEQIRLKKTVMACNGIDTGQDFDNYPPIIDIERVDTVHPSNETYVRWLKSHGAKFPTGAGQSDRDKDKDEKEEANMAVMEKLMDRAFQNTDDAGSAATKVAEVMGEGAKKAMEMVVEGAAQARSMATQGQDPAQALTVFREVGSMFTDLLSRQPQAQDSALTLELMRQNSELQKQNAEANTRSMQIALDMERERFKELKDELREMRAQAIAQQMNGGVGGGGGGGGGVLDDEPGTQTSSPKDPLTAIKEARRLISALSGGDDDDEGGGVGIFSSKRRNSRSIWETMLEAAAPALPTIIGALVQMLPGINAAALPPVPPPTANPELPPGIDPQMGQVMDQPTAMPTGQPTTQRQVHQGLQFLEQITAPLLRHYSRDEIDGAGYDFAEWLIDGFGRQSYEEIVGNKDLIITMIHSYPPLNTPLSRVPHRTDQFFTEFFGYDAEMARVAAEEGDGDGDGEENNLPTMPVVKPKVKIKRKVLPVIVPVATMPPPMPPPSLDPPPQPAA